MGNTSDYKQHGSEGKTSKHINLGLLAHVDAGKTTLSEGMLYLSGTIRDMGRVDYGNAFLDTYQLERERGITIFSKQAVLTWKDTEITLLDTPGHVDFSAEMERTLQVLDCAVLVISAADGVQGHTETLWKLLKRYQIPVFVFVNKMDQDGADKSAVLRERLDYYAARGYNAVLVTFDTTENLSRLCVTVDGIRRAGFQIVIAYAGRENLEEPVFRDPEVLRRFLTELGSRADALLLGWRRTSVHLFLPDRPFTNFLIRSAREGNPDLPPSRTHLKLEAEGDEKTFEASVNLQPAFPGIFRKRVRSLHSSSPGNLTIRDRYSLLEDGDGVRFNWMTPLPVRIQGRNVEIRGRLFTLSFSVPEEWKLSCEKRERAEGYPPLNCIMLDHSSSSGELELNITIRKNPTRQESAS